MPEQDSELLRQSITANMTSVMEMHNELAPHFEKQQHGHIAVISSVAGDRGRRSNYVYGAAKSGLDACLSGLRQRLWNSDVNVLTVKPGFVDTPMTEAFPKNFLWASPEIVGEGIYRAMLGNLPVVYLPKYWRWIMWLIRALPEFLFKRLSF